MKNLIILLFGAVLFAAACSDPEKDPLQFEKITKGSLISLRGQAVANLNDLAFVGAVDSFSVSGDNSTNNFEFQADFIAEDPTTLAEVQVYGKATESGPRQRVGVVPGSAFVDVADSKYPRGTFSFPMTAVLAALSKNASDFAVGSYIYIECDLLLTDGSVIPSSSIVNSSLFETGYFYPAHNLLIRAGQ